MLTTSCGYATRLEVPNSLTDKPKIVEDFTPKSTPLKKENLKIEEVEPDFNDEKLAYIYKHRQNLHICEEIGLRRDAIGKFSKVHKVNSQTYILEVHCGRGAYSVYYEYILYLIKHPISVNGIDRRRGPAGLAIWDGHSGQMELRQVVAGESHARRKTRSCPAGHGERRVA